LLNFGDGGYQWLSDMYYESNYIRGDSLDIWGGARFFVVKNFLVVKFGEIKFLCENIAAKNCLALSSNV